MVLPVKYDYTISFVRFADDDGIIMAEVMQGSLLFFREAKGVLLLLAIVIKCGFIFGVQVH